MVLIVGDDVEELLHGPESIFKYGNLLKNSQIITNKSEQNINGIVCQGLPSGTTSGSSQKGNTIWFDQKMKKNKINIILLVRIHLMGCWDGGHMTNHQKWSKTKAVALHCSFLNLVELCSEVLPLRRYDVKDFEKCCVFFVFFFFRIFLHENKTKQYNFITFRKLKERATIIASWEK